MFKRSISFAFVGIFAMATAQAETVTVTQLTNNSINDTNFWLNNVGDVSWTAYEAGDTEVYLYDASTQSTIAVTNNDMDDYAGMVNNQGDLIWIQHEPNPNGAFVGDTFKKVMHRSAVDGAITELARSEFSINSLQMNDNGDIVWMAYEANGNSANVFKFDAATGTITNLTADFVGSSYYPQLNNRGDVAWSGHDGNDQDVYLFTASTGSVVNVSNNDFNDGGYTLKINNNADMVWPGYDGVEGHIYRYDGTTGITKQLTVDNGIIDSSAWINSAGDVVWSAYNNIMLYDANTQTISALTNDTLYRSNAVMDANGNVVWQGLDPNGTDYDMFFYDRAAGTITNISNNDVDDYFYWMNNHGDFAWTSGFGTASEIMFYSNTTKAVTQITNDNLDDMFVVINDQLDMVWTRNDGDIEIMLGKVQTTTPLDFTYSRATQDVNDGEIKIRINSELTLPAATDQITVSLDGVTVLDVAFNQFVADDYPGKFEYKNTVVEAKLDIATGSFKIEVDGVLASTLDTTDGVYLEISIGNAAGAGLIQITPVDDGHYDYDGYYSHDGDGGYNYH